MRLIALIKAIYKEFKRANEFANFCNKLHKELEPCYEKEMKALEEIIKMGNINQKQKSWQKEHQKETDRDWETALR